MASTEKLTNKIDALSKDANYFSLEFFPPKTAMGAQNLQARLERMSRGLRPLFVTVTWGAGGSTASKSLELAEWCQMLGLTTCIHLTCTNMSRKLLDETLDSIKALGIRNILALRGDPPRDDFLIEEKAQGDDIKFVYAIDLVKYIKREYGDYFCIGVAAYPEGHGEGSHPERQSLSFDMPYLVEKVQAGADFIMTQLFFDVEKFNDFEKVLRNHESRAFKDLPIIPGLMPVQSYQILQRTTKLSHAALPQTLQERFAAVKNDDEAVKAVGVDVLTNIVESIRSVPCPVRRGFHFYTLNLEKAVAHVLERCGLIPDVKSDFAMEVSDSLTVNGASKKSLRRRSSVTSDPHNRVIVDKVTSDDQAEVTASAEEAGQSKLLNPRSRGEHIAISEGEGSLGREATWDDFPNGRFGDARSPAFGEIDGYGVSLHMSPAEATKLWSHPTSVDDISSLFVRNVSGTLDRLPWSEDDLRAESLTIQRELIQMNKKGWWTLASQPAVNGAKSSDETFGWGPKGGYVFQKAFVEFFICNEDWSVLKEKLDKSEDVSYYAGTKSGEFVTNVEDDKSGAMHAVTWGVFPGKEIQSTTIIEEVSFKAWRDEAFAMWVEWQRVYAMQSDSWKLLGHISEDYWLVNLVHHDYIDEKGLWRDVLDLKD